MLSRFEHTLAYRADIDGLRAIAVLSVVLYHLNFYGFSGGYVGVDVFFVISGYLITSLILTEIRQRKFSLRVFYLRRVRRIAPALLVVSISIAAAAQLILYPEDMRSFAASLSLQFLSLQNVFFLADGEYFRGSLTKPLLHTWSLAIEEQFYLVWPLLLMSISRFKFKTQLVLILSVMSGSFALNLALMPISPKASFFLLPPRAWELVIGGFIAMLEAKNIFRVISTTQLSATLTFIGLIAILTSVNKFSADTAFPGIAVLLPVLGATLIIIGGIGWQTPIKNLLSHPSIVHIGLISYPIYLWHWPLIVLSSYINRSPTTWIDTALILAATVILAELTYRVIELPIRKKQWLPTTRLLLIATGMTAAMLSAFGIHLYVTDGAAYRFSAIARTLLTAPFAANSQRCGIVFRMLHPYEQICALHDDQLAKRRVLLWGNSHADMWSSLFTRLGVEYHTAVYLNARNCRALPDSDFCGQQVQKSVLHSIVLEHITDVVLASTWYGSYDRLDELMEQDLLELVSKLSSLGVRTWLVIDAPSSASLNPITAFEKNPSAPRFGTMPILDHVKRQQREQALFMMIKKSNKNKNVEIIDPSVAFCSDTLCLSGIKEQSWYRDSGHLTDAGALAAKNQFVPVFAKFSDR